eukprot:TRINITY_DN6156_c0_g4_i1.p1 TRINITY_DN6156_c0_g4~~TRINITY_DN6156_c0_g4_i1.p1  ORF type:complete len:148 (+),score=19.03 TRINITY_DN6156_c0_g4_i1:60-503(+)
MSFNNVVLTCNAEIEVEITKQFTLLYSPFNPSYADLSKITWPISENTKAALSQSITQAEIQQKKHLPNEAKVFFQSRFSPGLSHTNGRFYQINNNVGSQKIKIITCFDQIRPISLCNVDYKIFSSVLSNRLKKIPDEVTSPTQTQTP